jgi:hypothetical protein
MSNVVSVLEPPFQGLFQALSREEVPDPLLVMLVPHPVGFLQAACKQPQLLNGDLVALLGSEIDNLLRCLNGFQTFLCICAEARPGREEVKVIGGHSNHAIYSQNLRPSHRLKSGRMHHPMTLWPQLGVIQIARHIVAGP